MTKQSAAGPGGYLVKDFADGWYWTPNADLDHAAGAAVWSIADNRYETVLPALAIPAGAEDVRRTMDGETVCGFRVAAWRYIGPQDSDVARFGHRYCEHWSTVGNAPKKVERLFTEDQLRAAMLTAAPVREEGGAVDRVGLTAELHDYLIAARRQKSLTIPKDLGRRLLAALAAREEAPAEAGEWISWSGGQNPAPGQIVEPRFRVGGNMPADFSDRLRWSSEGLNEDIVAYRIRAQPQARSGE